jgi:BASS family bile acid:Na+ symporter
MTDMLQTLLRVTIAIFMAGSLLQMGLKLDLKKATSALVDARFMLTALLWSFVIGPALAVFLARALPLAEPYALGLILLGLAPGAPFMPLLAEKAGADINHVAAYLLLASIGSEVILPAAIPVLAPELSADAWAISRPLLLFIALPLAIGICLGFFTGALADKLHPIVKNATNIDIALMLAIVMVLFWRDFLGAIGSYAIAAQILYYCSLAAGAYGLSFALSHEKRSTLALGLCTRNIGAAMAPLLTTPTSDDRAMVMCILAVFITLIMGFGVAHLLGRLQPAAKLAGENAPQRRVI